MTSDAAQHSVHGPMAERSKRARSWGHSAPTALAPGLEEVMAHGIEEIARMNESAPRSAPTMFDSVNVTTIPLVDYLKRLCKYTACSTNVLTCALIYIDRLVVWRKLTLRSHNIHRVVLACLVVAIKYNDDRFCSNAYYAKVGGVPPRELNRLEVTLLSLLNFDLYVDEEHFKLYQSEILRTTTKIAIAPHAT
eukprot:TRINITY_DN23221_c0_g1_i1.p1 TRINITY_DN23221_c0_g1~~TRINITY_DN23221_c0_g1_i1.p1  ORF type:complete len:193 (-),score=54.95 TRINITY_DN23221_c0_g1_i1:269-847(-)